jgi:glycosyltransferase involved in cell wall biosynthesis
MGLSGKMKVTKILIVCGAGIVAGKEIMALTLGRALREQGCDPEFVTSNWCDREFMRRMDCDNFKYYQVRIGYISLSLRIRALTMTLDQLRYLPSLFFNYFTVITRLSPQVVIHTNLHHAVLLLPFLNPRRDIYWAHDFVQKEAFVFRRIAERVGQIVCVSHAVAGSMKAAGVPESKITVIHNGIPVGSGLPTRMKNGPLRLGIVGQIGSWKGHEDAFDAVSIVADRGISVALKVYGKGNENYIQKLREKAAKLGIVDRVEWCGFVANPKEIFSAIDICMVPSRSPDALPTSAIEACSFGRPVICSWAGGLPEIVEHGATGFVVEPKRPDQLAECIVSFHQDPGLITRMGEAAFARATNEFSLARFTRQFINVIERIQMVLNTRPIQST